MTRIHYVNGVMNILWGLILVIPLLKGFNTSDAIIIVPLIVVFIVTGIGLINNKSFAWTPALVLGFLILIHFAISIFNETLKPTDIRLGTQAIILFSIWSAFVFLTLCSSIGILTKKMRMKLNVQKAQALLTFSICIVTGILWGMFLWNAKSWG